MKYIFNIAFIAALISMYPSEALPVGAPGPSVSTEISSAAQVTLEDVSSHQNKDSQESTTAKQTSAESDSRLTKYTHTLNLYAPLAKSSAGTFILNFKGASQTRVHSGLDDQLSRLSPLQVMKLGLIYLPEEFSDGTQLFFLASRWSTFVPRTDIRPLGEYILGADIDLAKRGLEFSGFHHTQGRLLGRVRNFAHGNEYLVVAEYRFKWRDNWNFEISIPSHLKAQWTSLNGNWSLYGITSATSFQAPVRFENQYGWINGVTYQAYAGVRKHLGGIFYAAIEAGIQQEKAEYYGEERNSLRSQSTSFAPWGRAKIETYLD